MMEVKALIDKSHKNHTYLRIPEEIAQTTSKTTIDRNSLVSEEIGRKI
ncbi:MAG: hypothetical protein AAF519_11545 [Bacteroidota bacterium]